MNLRLNSRREDLLANNLIAKPDPTAVRVALWRALHLLVDPAPHVINDDIGAQLAAPADEES